MAAFSFAGDRREPVFLEQLHGRVAVAEQEVVFADADPEQFQPLLQIGVIEFGLMLFEPRFAGGSYLRRGVRGGRSASARSHAPGDVEQAGTEYADVTELLQIRQRDVERLIATHREPRDCAVFAAGEKAVILFDIRHDVGHEILNELVRRRRAAARLSDSRQWPTAKWPCVSGG